MTVHKPWWSEGLRFDCLGCGRCCRGAPGGIFMTPREERRIADYLSLSLEDFRRRYETDRWRFCSIAEGAGGRCVMHGADNRCSIYPCRPISCRTWPFWPELLESSDAWNAAARKCPGMGQGTWWEGWRIEAVLKAHISHKQSLSGAAEAGKGGR